MKRIIHFILIALFLIPSCAVQASHQPEFSTAGFFQLPNSGREVFSMNPAWRFYKGAVEGAEATNFDDAEWTVVSLPNGIEYLPTEASGCINYQEKSGIASTSPRRCFEREETVPALRSHHGKE